ncbi:MAG: cation transporter [Eggerthellaceae bacterium]|nr:cation transporter [Eggerthellaceae bacterium]
MTIMAKDRQREREIVKASAVGIGGNLLLVAFKLAVGFASNSIAIVLDAVNNATDVMSSVVTIVGTKLAGRRPDRHHPFGYGRIEYLTSVVIAAIILAAGIVSLRESVVKIMHPAETSYSAVTIGVIVAAIVVKVALGLYFRRAGRATRSEALVASGIDSDYDAVLSAGTLVVAFAQNVFDVNIDGAVGLIISLVVIKAGVEVLRDAVSPLIGDREDEGLVSRIEAYVTSFDGVRGAYDLILDNFGPNEVVGSLHIEVDDDMTARQIHLLTRRMAEGLYDKFGFVATIGVYASNTTGEFAPMRAALQQIADEHPAVLQVHGFFVDEEAKTVYFDLVIQFKVDPEAVRDQVVGAMEKRYPGWRFDVVIDADYED